MDNETFRKVVEQLRYLSGSAGPITSETEVYADLGLYGDDIFELVLWMHKEFGVEPTHSDNVFVYAPTEMTFFGIRESIKRLLGISPRRYKSLKVRDLVSVIEKKQWPIAKRS